MNYLGYGENIWHIFIIWSPRRKGEKRSGEEVLFQKIKIENLQRYQATD